MLHQIDKVDVAAMINTVFVVPHEKQFKVCITVPHFISTTLHLYHNPINYCNPFE